MASTVADSYQGDPRLIIYEEGSSISFKSGQPVMDRGVENAAIISLFTHNGWAGNHLFLTGAQKLGSSVDEVSRLPITKENLIRLRNSVLEALSSDLFGDVTVEVSNSIGAIIDLYISVSPPTGVASDFKFTRNGLNWISQRIDPANRRL